MSDFRSFLEGDRVKSEAKGRHEPKCKICCDPVVSKEVAEYAKGVQDGVIAFSVWQIWKQYFQPRRSVGHWASIRTHIQQHLGIDL